jgi:hypothetical protein
MEKAAKGLSELSETATHALHGARKTAYVLHPSDIG